VDATLLLTPTHVGVVVPDLEAAMADFSGSAGEWIVSGGGPRQVTFLSPEGEFTITHLTAWSHRPPFYVEVIKSVPRRVWEPRPEAYLHHLGYWVDDFDGAVDQAESAGMRLLLTRPGGRDGRPLGFAYYRLPIGPIVEFVDRATSASVRMLVGLAAAGGRGA
jgi:catechol 2,3-dioxygenase-like lactoylglutathione lyase family enzyme